jgi:hypothetical protein
LKTATDVPLLRRSRVSACFARDFVDFGGDCDAIYKLDRKGAGQGVDRRRKKTLLKLSDSARKPNDSFMQANF